MKFDLEKYRKWGDEPIDELVRNVVDNEGVDYLKKLLPFLSDYRNLSFEKESSLIREYVDINCTFPSNINKKNIIRCCEFYSRYRSHIDIILGLYSLPYCYLGADGAKVLYQSERIRKDTKKRLLETGQFVKSMMNEDNWRNNHAILICFKVRLLHGIIRYFLLHSNKWDIKWGIPINQEDMAGTNLAFSWIVLKGLKKMGIWVDEAYEKAYLDTWNKIGLFLGITPELIVENYYGAVHLDKQISERQFRESVEGKELTNALISTIREFAPNKITADLIQEQSRYFLGDDYAEMLGISRTNIPSTLLKIYTHTATMMNKIFA